LSRSGPGLDRRQGHRPRRDFIEAWLRGADAPKKLSSENRVMDLRANWNYPTAVRFGAGRVTELAEAVKAAGMKNPLFVTDPVLAKLPMTNKAMALLPSAQMFSAIKPNPVEQNVTDGVAAFKRGNHDGVVAFGGGSAISCVKLVAFMAGQTRPVWDFEDVGDWWTRAYSSAIAPIVALPTTAGTGSEVGRA